MDINKFLESRTIFPRAKNYYKELLEVAAQWGMTEGSLYSIFDKINVKREQVDLETLIKITAAWLWGEVSRVLNQTIEKLDELTEQEKEFIHQEAEKCHQRSVSQNLVSGKIIFNTPLDLIDTKTMRNKEETIKRIIEYFLGRHENLQKVKATNYADPSLEDKKTENIKVLQGDEKKKEEKPMTKTNEIEVQANQKREKAESNFEIILRRVGKNNSLEIHGDSTPEDLLNSVVMLNKEVAKQISAMKAFNITEKQVLEILFQTATQNPGETKKISVESPEVIQ